MSRYSIKDLESLSGIKAHTIRIWEKRYNLLLPERTDTNIRYYSDEQLRSLLNISSLLKFGWKISKIAELTKVEIGQQLDLLTNSSLSSDNAFFSFTNQLISSGLSYDEKTFDKTFSAAVLRYGINDTYLFIIYPLLVRIGVMWSKSDIIPSQEHFISNLLKQKIFAAIDGTSISENMEAPWVLLLPEEENHEIGLLYANLILRQHGQKVIYLGQRVPFTNLNELLTQFSEANVLLFLVREQPTVIIEEYIALIEKTFPKVTVNIACSKDIKGRVSDKLLINWIHSVEELLKKV